MTNNNRERAAIHDVAQFSYAPVWVIILMAAGCHDTLPRSAFSEDQLDFLLNWLNSATK
jgi:hypothetical protein